MKSRKEAEFRGAGSSRVSGDQCGEGGKVQPTTLTDGLADLSGLPVSTAAFVLRHLRCRARLRALCRRGKPFS